MGTNRSCRMQDDDELSTNTRVEEWINNRRIVTKGDCSVCEICLRWVKRCPHYLSCIKIQTIYRGVLARRRVALKKTETARALVAMQRVVRGYIARFTVKQLRLERTQAATTLQKIARGHKARIYVSQKAALDLNAATCIQATMAAFATRRQTQMIHNSQLASAVGIQRIWKGLLSRRTTKRLAGEARGAAIDIQRVWRGAKSRKDTASAHESWNLIKGEIMSYLPHSVLQASMALQRLPVSAQAKYEILMRLPIAESVKTAIHQEIGNANRPPQPTSLDSLIKGQVSAPQYQPKSRLAAGFIRPADVRSRFISYRRFGVAPAAE